MPPLNEATITRAYILISDDIRYHVAAGGSYLSKIQDGKERGGLGTSPCPLGGPLPPPCRLPRMSHGPAAAREAGPWVKPPHTQTCAVGVSSLL